MIHHLFASIGEKSGSVRWLRKHCTIDKTQMGVFNHADVDLFREGVPLDAAIDNGKPAFQFLLEERSRAQY